MPIIKDAFREAFWSRTLWVLLILITLFLLALVPLGFREILSNGVGPEDVRSPSRLFTRMVRDVDSEINSPARHLYQSLSEPLQTSIRKAAEGSEEVNSLVIQIQLSEELNKAMKEDAFYDADAWSTRRLRSEVKELLESDSLSQEELEHRNRLLLEEAFPGIIRSAPEREIELTYLIFSPGYKFQMSRAEFYAQIQSIVLYFLLFVFGTVGIFVAIMVTRPDYSANL